MSKYLIRFDYISFARNLYKLIVEKQTVCFGERFRLQQRLMMFGTEYLSRMFFNMKINIDTKDEINKIKELSNL